jgi:hypothetical protein
MWITISELLQDGESILLALQTIDKSNGFVDVQRGTSTRAESLSDADDSVHVESLKPQMTANWHRDKQMDLEERFTHRFDDRQDGGR